MLAPIACGKRAWRPFGRLSGSQPSAWFWAWSWDPLRFMRRHPPHHLSPVRANYSAGQDRSCVSRLQSHHSNAPIKPISQSNLSNIVALLTDTVGENQKVSGRLLGAVKDILDSSHS